MKKGRHRRYEEARALKRGGDLDIDSIFEDLSGSPPPVSSVDDDADHASGRGSDNGADAASDSDVDDDESVEDYEPLDDPVEH